ncbi:nitroreductase family protein [Acetomicrobium sp.]|uniref:nitroreductase family protein n=1 Tax=Acetomicrobium sp. TaxID=1872099 RepID=UPI003D96E20F
MIELLRKRRSIRRFKDKPIEQEKIDILKEAALRSPTCQKPCTPGSSSSSTIKKQ